MWITRDVDETAAAEIFFWQNEPELIGEMYEDPTGECDFLVFDLIRFKDWFEFSLSPGEKVHCSLSLVVERPGKRFSEQEDLFK